MERARFVGRAIRAFLESDLDVNASSGNRRNERGRGRGGAIQRGHFVNNFHQNRGRGGRGRGTERGRGNNVSRGRGMRPAVVRDRSNHGGRHQRERQNHRQRTRSPSISEQIAQIEHQIQARKIRLISLRQQQQQQNIQLNAEQAAACNEPTQESPIQESPTQYPSPD